MSSTRRRDTLAVAAALAVAAPLLAALSSSTSADAAQDHGLGFTRVDVDAAVTGASFTSVGEIYPGEQNIVTAGYGALTAGAPSDGGTLQVYRPGASLEDWTKVQVFDADADLIFPNRPTIVDVDSDGLNDVLQPSGYFFDTDPGKPGGAQSRSAITWWENLGVDEEGVALGFTRHDVITGQAGSYHGAQLVDLDADGIRDIVTTSEAGRIASDQADDAVELQYLKGNADLTFQPPVVLADGSGGSVPVVHDVDGDGRLDIVSSQYFEIAFPFYGVGDNGKQASFMWFEQVGATAGGLTAANFVKHSIAEVGAVGHGFQIRPVPNFREPGTVSWIATNHQNRCFIERISGGFIKAPVEAVMEFVPGADVRDQWDMTLLSTPYPQASDPADCDDAFKVSTSPTIPETYVPFHPGGEITARTNAGQGAPGVLGHGDLDGDGDQDLLVSGDGDRRLFWIEQLGDGDTVLRRLSGLTEEFGQSGGAEAADFDGDGRLEAVFSSFDKNAVAVWKTSDIEPEPTPPPTTPTTAPTTVPTTTPTTTPTTKPTPAVVTKKSVLSASRGTIKVSRSKKRAKVSVKVSLKAAVGGGSRKVTVTFKPAKGKRVKVATVTLRPGASGRYTGKLSWKPPRKAGTLTFSYAGRKVSPYLKDTAAKRVVKVRLVR